MDSTRDEKDSRIHYNCLAADRKSTNSTSRSQLKSSEGNTYEVLSTFESGDTPPLVKKEEGKKLLILFILLTSALSLLFCLHYLEVVNLPVRGSSSPYKTRKARETAAAQTRESNDTIIQLKNNTEIWLATINEQRRIISETIDRHVEDLIQLKGNTSTLMRKLNEQNDEISKFKNNAAESNLKASICLGNITKLKDNSTALQRTIDDLKKQIDHQAADLIKLENNSSKLLEINEQQNQTIARQSTDINQLENKINELAPEHTSVMLTGGWISGMTTSTTIYNSVEKNWTTCKLTLPHKLANHGAVVLNNEIYILGGYADGVGDKPFNTVYKMGANNTWENMAPMIEKRGSIPQSSVVFNSEIWVIGGWNGSNAMKSVEKYNSKTNSWTKMPELVVPRASAGAAVIDGKIYISSSLRGQKNSVEVYDPEKNKWEIFSTMPQEMHIHTLTGNHSQLIVNGEWKMDVLDPKRKWEEMPSLQQKRTNTGAAKITDGLMVFGGAISHSQRIDSVEIFDGIKWNEGPKLPEIRGVFAYFPLTCAQERLFLKRYCS